jgi:hypothetical protein
VDEALARKGPQTSPAGWIASVAGIAALLLVAVLPAVRLKARCRAETCVQKSVWSFLLPSKMNEISRNIFRGSHF